MDKLEAITANELMAGNYFLFRHQRGDVFTKITPNHIVGCEKHNESFNRFFTPIPITEYILLKAGALKYSNQFDSLERVYYDKFVLKGVCFRIDSDSKIFRCVSYKHIKFIHQIQNLFTVLNEQLTIEL